MADDIRESFAPWYTATVAPTTDPNLLYDTRHQLNPFGILWAEEVEHTVRLLVSNGRNHGRVHAALTPATDMRGHGSAVHARPGRAAQRHCIAAGQPALDEPGQRQRRYGRSPRARLKTPNETRFETPAGCREFGTPSWTNVRQHETLCHQGVSWSCGLNLACARRDSNPCPSDLVSVSFNGANEAYSGRRISRPGCGFVCSPPVGKPVGWSSR